MMNAPESQKTREDIDRKLLRLLQRAACVAELCPGVTHKLNNALAGTLSNLELITMEKSLPAEILESHQWSQQAAWQAADLNRAFVEFLTRSDSNTGSVDLDGLLAQVVQFFRRFSDRRVEVSHVPSPRRIYAQVNSTMLSDSIVALALLGQRQLGGGGSILFSATQNGALATIKAKLGSSVGKPGVFQPEPHQLLEWLARSLAETAGGTLETESGEGRPSAFLLHLPASA